MTRLSFVARLRSQRSHSSCFCVLVLTLLNFLIDMSAPATPALARSTARFGATPSSMVADLFTGSDNVVAASGLSTTVPVLKSTFKPRTASPEAKADYDEELRTLISHNEALLVVLDNPPPTLAVCASRWTDLGRAALDEAFAKCLQEYEAASDLVYRVIRPSLDLSGAYERFDKDMIRRTFIKGSGALRDGHGLYRWSMHFRQQSDLGAQLQLQRDLPNIKLAPSANQEQLILHMQNLFDTFFVH